MQLTILGTDSVSLVLVCLVLILIARCVTQSVRFHRTYCFPGMVAGLPIIGNSLQMPRKGQGPFLKDLADKYGEMFTMKFGTTYWVFLNSNRVATELLEKRASIYSSRPSLPMAHELISQGRRILLMPYNDLWRRERRDIESKTLLYQYLHTPQSWWQSHARYSNSIVMSVVFGRRSQLNDPNLNELLATAEEFVPYLIPGLALVDLLPFLSRIAWFKSWQPWRWYGDDLYRRTRNVYKREISDLLERRKEGIQKPCFMTEFLDSGNSRDFSEDELYFIAGALMEAGSDTTRVALHEVVAASALFPDWVERARVELDQICGANAERLPEPQDLGACPLVRAAVKESLRWRPAMAESGIPHMLTKDDEFEGYRLPAGTVITWNHWGIANSASEYKDPDRFWPERFLNEDLDKATKGHLGFGAGRRVCVGYQVAVDNLLIAIARMVYCFDFMPDPSSPINVSTPFYNGSRAPPFKVVIKPRSLAHGELIERECRSAALSL